MKKKALAALLILCLLLLGALMLLQTAADERIQHAMNHSTPRRRRKRSITGMKGCRPLKSTSFFRGYNLFTR